jgi:hypothetical protein
MIAGIGDGLLCGHCAPIQLRFADVVLSAFPRFGHNAVGLMSILRGQIPMLL